MWGGGLDDGPFQPQNVGGLPSDDAHAAGVIVARCCDKVHNYLKMPAAAIATKSRANHTKHMPDKAYHAAR